MAKQLLRRAYVLALLGVAVVTSVSAAAQPKTIQVVIEGIAFSPVALSAKVGDTIEWVNKDIVDHTATDKKGAWDVTVGAAKKARVELKKAGTVDYYCRYHPNMKAQITVAAR